MLRSVTKLFLFFAIFFCLFQSAWADKIYLKNGNVLEGNVVEEDSNSVLLDFALDAGSGNTRIKKLDIESIEKGSFKAPAVNSSKDKAVNAGSKQEPASNLSKSQEDLQKVPKEYQKGILLITLSILAGFLLLSFAALFFLSKIARAKFGRPFCIKIACFYLSGISIFYILLGLMFVSLAANRVIFDFKGINLFVFYFFMLGVPILLFILMAGLFYLKNWARISAVVLLGLGLVNGIITLASKKDFTTSYFSGFYQKATQQFGSQLERFSQPQADIGTFNPRATFISVFLFLLIILYFFRKETKNSFSEAGQFKEPISIDKRWLILFSALFLITAFTGNKIYQEGWKGFFHNPYLFMRPSKAGGVMKENDLFSKGLIEYQALDHYLYLPPGMEKKHLPVAESKFNTVLFLEKNRNISFIISEIGEEEYRITIASFYARWNPLLIILKPRSISEKLLSVKTFKFKDREGIMERGTTEDVTDYRFTFKTDKSEYMQCTFMVRDKVYSFDEQRVLDVIAAIK